MLVNATKFSFSAGVDWTGEPTEWLHLTVPSRISRHVKFPSSDPIKTLLSCSSIVGELKTLLFKSAFQTKDPLLSFIAYKLPSVEPINIFSSPSYYPELAFNIAKNILNTHKER